MEFTLQIGDIHQYFCIFAKTLNTKIMRFIITFLFLTLLSQSLFSREWNSDILGNNYMYTTIKLPNDYSGEVKATVIKKLPPQVSDKSILYIHGYNDYFFQSEMGDKFVNHGYNFYAIDLRKYGRSIINKATQFEVRDLSEYFSEIDSAIHIIKENHSSNIILMGHSTGGLIASYYMLKTQNRECIDAMILNSPFLDFNLSEFEEDYLLPLVSVVSTAVPSIKISQNSNDAYAQSLLSQYHGEWKYNTEWKLPLSPDVTTGWLGAIYKAQRTLHIDANIKVPILLIRSNISVYGNEWDKDFNRGDAVLDVNDISYYGRKLGPNVKELVVKEGLHDIILSRKPIREAVYKYMFNWLESKSLN